MNTTTPPSTRFAAWWAKLPEALRDSYRAGPTIMAAHAAWVAATEEARMTDTETLSADDLAHIARESLISAVCERRAYPPRGWCEEFDAAHSYIPAWALPQWHTAAEAFITHCQLGGRSTLGALASSLRRWLRDNPQCAEAAQLIPAIEDAYADRAEDPRGWAQYAEILDGGVY